MHNIYSTVHPTLMHGSMATEQTHTPGNKNVTLLEFQGITGKVFLTPV